MRKFFFIENLNLKFFEKESLKKISKYFYLIYPSEILFCLKNYLNYEIK